MCGSPCGSEAIHHTHARLRATQLMWQIMNTWAAGWYGPMRTWAAGWAHGPCAHMGCRVVRDGSAAKPSAGPPHLCWHSVPPCSCTHRARTACLGCRVVRDGSINAPSRGCTAVEVVSPILSGLHGLAQIHRQVQGRLVLHMHLPSGVCCCGLQQSNQKNTTPTP